MAMTEIVVVLVDRTMVMKAVLLMEVVMVDVDSSCSLVMVETVLVMEMMDMVVIAGIIMC